MSKDSSCGHLWLCWNYLPDTKYAFGLYQVDFDDKELRRRPKLSAHWYSKFFKNIKEKKIERAGVNSMPLSALLIEAYHKCNVNRGLKCDS